MKPVQIDLYRRGPGGTDARTPLRSIQVRVESSKQLTAGRARSILWRTLPDYHGQHVIKVDGGWEASRTISPLPGCTYHYTWEHAVVYETEGDAEPGTALDR